MRARPRQVLVTMMLLRTEALIQETKAAGPRARSNAVSTPRGNSASRKTLLNYARRALIATSSPQRSASTARVATGCTTSASISQTADVQISKSSRANAPSGREQGNATWVGNASSSGHT